MKKIALILLLAASVLTSWAYDFSAVAPSGQTLYYNISGSTASVTYPGSSSWLGYTTPAGDLTIPSSVTYNGIAYSVTSIGDYAFRGCDGLISVTIPNSVTSIGNYAFYECRSLTSASIPNSVTSIGYYAFCMVRNIDYHGTATGSPWGALSVNGYVEHPLVFSDNTKTHLIGCSADATSVSIPNSVTSIGDYAFADCYSLTSLTIPNSVTYIGEGAFCECHRLMNITIPNSVTSIGGAAFSNCTSLPCITIPSSVTSIEGRTFYQCTNLASINIPNSVTTIEDEAFKECRNLTNITIPNSITFIGNYAFSFCERLTSVTIPNSVTSIRANAFSFCKSLTSVTIPNSVTSIGNYAFYYCSSLTSASIPNSVTFIGYDAFYLVRNIDYHGTATGSPWGALSVNGYVEHPLVFSDNTKTHLIGCSADATSVSIPNSVTSIGDNAFFLCESLTSVTIPNSVTSIGEMAFGDCYSLTSVTIPNSVTSIGEMAFGDCYSLTSVTIPNSVTSIGEWAFSYCNSLDTIVCKASTPPTVGYSYTFDGVPISCNVFVPCGTVDAYRSATGWIRFANFIESPSYSISVASANTTMGSASITQHPTCALPAIIEATPTDNHNFFCWSDGNTDNPRTIAPTQDVALIALFIPLLPIVHDTVAIHNTIEVHDTVAVHDTTYVFVPGTIATTIRLRDSIIMHDCAGSPHDTIFVRDTVRNCREQQLYIIVNNDTIGACDGSGYIPRGSEVQILAIPNRGFRFVGWNDGDTQNPRPLAINHAIDLTAIFEQE